MNVLLFVLATVAITFTSTIAVKAASPRRAPVPSAAPELAVLAVEDGVAIELGGANIAPGCAGAGAGVAVPKREGRSMGIAGARHPLRWRAPGAPCWHDDQDGGQRPRGLETPASAGGNAAPRGEATHKCVGVWSVRRRCALRVR